MHKVSANRAIARAISCFACMVREGFLQADKVSMLMAKPLRGHEAEPRAYYLIGVVCAVSPFIFPNF